MPPGPFFFGGDPEAEDGLLESRRTTDGFFVSRNQVTLADYCAFLTALSVESPDEALARSPRAVSSGVAHHYFLEQPPPGTPWRVPERDADGDRWEPGWAVAGISFFDAQAYAAWWSEQTGQPWGLLDEVLWEKAARGADRRLYPWGDQFDATLCHMRLSRPGTALPALVGSVESDRSVYGVRDVAGGMREWTQDPAPEYPGRRRTRGGAFDSRAGITRIGSRLSHRETGTNMSVSFRLCRRELPPLS